MRDQGRITEWNDDRGFGFITPLADESRLFVHISEFPRDARRPQVLDLVSYLVDHDERGRSRATGVLFMMPTVRGHPTSSSGPRPFSLVAPAVAALVLLTGLSVLVALGRIPASVFALYGFMSVLSFISYGSDKAAAQQGGRRIPESTLLTLGLLGGWPGGLLAQRIYRHKTRKISFQVGFWISVAANIAALLWIAVQLAATPG